MNTKSDRRFWNRVISITSMIFLGVSLLFVVYTSNQYDNYQQNAISYIQQPDGEETNNHDAVVTYFRTLDFLSTKTYSLVISMLIILVGLLYVLRPPISQAYISGKNDANLSTESDLLKGTFSTSSPGLMIIFFGVVLAIFSLQYRSQFEYSVHSSETNTIQSKNEAANGINSRENIASHCTCRENP